MTTNKRSPREEKVCLSSSRESSCSLFLRSCSQLKQVRQNELQSYVRPMIRYTGCMPRLSTRYRRYPSLSLNFIRSQPSTLDRSSKIRAAPTAVVWWQRRDEMFGLIFE